MESKRSLFIKVLGGVVAELNGHFGPPLEAWDKLARPKSSALFFLDGGKLLSA